MKRINIFIGIGIVIIVIIGGWLAFSNKVWQPPVIQEDNRAFQEEEEVKQEVVLVIDDGEGEPRTFEVEFNEGMTAFDLLKDKIGELNLTLETKSYDIGIFIEVIGDKENGTDGKYWMYYVNGEMPMVATDKKELNPGDEVEFRFELSPF